METINVHDMGVAGGYILEELLVKARADIAARNAMIYELAKNIIYYADKVSGDEEPDWIAAIANCTHPDDPRYLGEVVIEALSLMEAEDANS